MRQPRINLSLTPILIFSSCIIIAKRTLKHYPVFFHIPIENQFYFFESLNLIC